MMTASEIRQSFLEFFRGKHHTVVPSSSLLPASPNLLFTNAGMNQFVPIFLGETACPYRPPRAADTQKCIRAGGKHNDLEDVGLDTYHHTFFEMLGNWSFGDYFKAEAIAWAWELVVGRWGFPPDRLYATVYEPGPGEPGEPDQEARAAWARLFSAAGLDPRTHVRTGGKKDNFWMMGDTGPCGPCSEIHVDLTPEGRTEGRLVNTGSPLCLEIWNLVFIQFNARPDGALEPLPARHVDTGMGLERVAAIVQCTEGFRRFDRPVSNYETDLFHPLFEELEALSGLRYRSSLPGSGAASEASDIAFRAIADHTRALVFAVADGILPGNADRGYVLRRILRRAVRHGRTLGLREPFLFRLPDVVARTMGEAFPEVRERLSAIKETLHLEEEAFHRTLDKGLALFEEQAARLPAGGVIPGQTAFRLYDEQGFPLDLTELLARERGLTVDTAGFERLMEEQRARARAAQKREIIEVSSLPSTKETEFVGYDGLSARARVLEVVSLKGRPAVILDRTPCYAEMGGQVGDQGLLSRGSDAWKITDTRKVGSAALHLLAENEPPLPDAEVDVFVDAERRAAIARHHTATHLLHWAIHEVVSRAATQKGSHVGPDKLTFDFNSSALTPSQIADIERLVNERVLENARVTWCEQPYEWVRNRSDILQLFGEKYGGRVRVVQIGGEPGALNGYSMELCGGTHVRATGEVGLVRLVSESAIAAGIRRIEARAGLEAAAMAAADAGRLHHLARLLNCPLAELEHRVESLLEQAKVLEKALRAARQREAAAEARSLLAHAETLGRIPAIVREIPGAEGEKLQDIADALRGQFDGVVVLASAAAADRACIVATASPAYCSAVPAGKLVAACAPAIGGKGGGRPDSARGGGKNPAGLAEAIAHARRLIADASAT